MLNKYRNFLIYNIMETTRIIRATNTERIFYTIERVLLKRRINAIHAEARKYAFRTLDGVWHTADLDFVNDLSGLGNINKNMLDD